MVSLGYGKFVRSDDVTAIESIGEGRGPGRRTLVWVRGLPAPMVASRSEEAILEDMLKSPERRRSRRLRVLSCVTFPGRAKQATRATSITTPRLSSRQPNPGLIQH